MRAAEVSLCSGVVPSTVRRLARCRVHLPPNLLTGHDVEDVVDLQKVDHGAGAYRTRYVNTVS